ncbi:MAG: class I SAM-dependent methyltransferase [Mogibacterium sp.]|nr:class I SAM-dependent methyltransferase [Mogibacterium sp.]
MKETIDYYNRNADWYYWTTVAVDLDALRKKFASYLPYEATIIDMGCGSGRDVMAFSDMGHHVIGLDASEELVKLARERLEINAVVGDMSYWKARAPYDGIWCCASLIHLNGVEKKRFFNNLEYNLKPGGIIFISVKDGIETGIDAEGRYQSNCPEEELRAYLEGAGCEILEILTTEDALGRERFKWLNVFARKKEQ